MEWFLMKILEDGAFLLDRAEDGKRFNVSEWTTKDQIAADEFYDRALEELFGVVDDEDMTGIPEGLIELGNQILRKLDPKFVENTRSWLVYKWLFGAWLLNVVIHPEMYGLMMEYHITEYGRQKILKEVALRAQRLVFEKTMSMGASMGSKPVSTPPAIKIHIENILSRFCGTENSRPAARLLPARSITSLRETVEVHPYLVVSPADLATLVNALFPERQLFSPQLCGLRSETGSNQDFSVISQPVAIPAFQSKTDADSVLSSSASSTNSDATTFVEPAPDSRQTGTTSSTSFPFSSVDQKLSHRHEDNGYNLRLALQDMTHVLGSDCVRGSSHPCAERWAILFISADGKSLSAHMAHDFDEYDSVREDGTSSSDENDDFSDNELPRPERTQPEMDYHFVRKSIFKLVEEYDIPPQLGDDNGAVPTSNKAKLFDDRISNSESPAIETKKSSDVLPTLQSRNPYLRRVEGKIADLKKRPQFDEDPAFKKSVLISMLASASSQSQSQQNEFAALLNIFARGPRDSIRRSAAALETYETWLIWLKQSQERVEGALDTMEKRIRALRDKMWYVTDVRNSAPYEFARNIAIALKTMGASRKLDVHHRSRQSKTGGTATSYLYRVESELVELLAATDNQGGPNKLSDDQAEKTLSWLQHCDVTNLCQGEERIHRFSCEITSCVDKLIGESIAEAPVLWSSVLFSRDSRYLDSPGRAAMRDRDGTGVTWDDATSVQISGSNQRRSNLFDQSSSSIRGDPNGKGNPSTEETTASLEKPWNRVKSPEQIAETDKDCRSRILDVAQSTSVKERTHSECDPVVGQNIDRSQKKEAVASILQSLFCDPIIRPRTLFRDLQFIAAFVPSDILDRTERGKSFWAVGLAALLLKKEVCATMVELADEIIGVYTKPSKASIPVPATSSLSPPPSTASGDRPSSNSSSMGHSAHIPPSNTYSLSDAARMLTVAAKEGNPTSQRELALFYLTNPELVERTMLPLSKPREVFKKAIMDKYDGGSGSFGPSGMPGNGGGEAEFRGCGHGNSSGEDAAHVVHNNPAFMCLAIHWMEAAEQGGDELARMFLGQNKMTE
ncbi:hypothetical protein SEPCBS119000_004534 [Sporothrix epigloea]|uniref:Uncharacterized protein n=1 Tax=Sporothrix epigloea TaxID=1892477 RepID=A0ABP0DST4_9PEZI